ncbi:RNA-directed DNA polymerase, eukaryota [Tanacetum coccineum]
MKNIDLFSIKRCWGNLAFDYAHSAFVDLSEKKMLWDYLSRVIAQWAGEVVVMGDFNEVRKKDDRFVHGANAFNLFISNAGLEEVPLGGCSYTWCYKSASKISKFSYLRKSYEFMSKYLCYHIGTLLI